MKNRILKLLAQRAWRLGEILFRDRNPKSLDSFLDRDIGAYAIANISRKEKLDGHAVAVKRAGGQVFNQEYINSLNLSTEGRQLFEVTLHSFLLAISPLFSRYVNSCASEIYPWRVAFFFTASTDLNARVRESFDKRENLVFVDVNVGVLLRLLHEICAVLHVPNAMLHIAGRFEPLKDEVERAQGKYNVPREGNWLATFPNSERLLKVAIDMAVKGAVSVVMHEFGHFHRGHLSYLREHELIRSGDALSEAGEAEEVVLEPSLRRILELDADESAGGAVSVFWRAREFPAQGPDDSPMENFYVSIVLSTIWLFLIIERCELTQGYYSPTWRIQHFLRRFYENLFDNSGGLDLSDSEHVANSSVLTGFYFQCDRALERAFGLLGWNAGFSTARFHIEAETLLGPDSQRLREVAAELRAHFPWVKHY